MSKYNTQGDVLAQSTNCWVYVDMEDENGSNPQKVGFVQNWSIRKNLQTNKAKCIGEIAPVSIDVIGIDVTVNFSGFIPTKEVATQGISVRGGGTYSVKAFNPNCENLLDTKVVTKIPYLEIRDDKHKTIISSVQWLTPTTYSESGSTADYIKTDASFDAIFTDNGPDYESTI